MNMTQATPQTRPEILDRHYRARGGARLGIEQYRAPRDSTPWWIAMVAITCLVCGFTIGLLI